MEEVAHRVHEDPARRRPTDRVAELLRYEPEIEAELKRMTFYAAETFGERLGVAMLAARADLRAAAHRIPRGIRPFDLGVFAHGSSARSLSPGVGQPQS